MRLEPIGHVESPYLTKFGVPRQPGIVSSVQTRLVIKPECCTSDAVLGLCVGDWITVLWCFSHNMRDAGSWSKTVRPPILGGVKRQGVFATRSSFRPNGLAISCVKIAAIDKGSLTVIGGDMVDGTPIYDIYPYDGGADCLQDAIDGWSGEAVWPMLESIHIPDEQMAQVPAEYRSGLLEILRQDPRPAYTRHGQKERVFWTVFGECIIWFEVNDSKMNVLKIERMTDKQRNAIIETGNLPE